MTPTAQTSSTLDGLPKQFVNALRTLFDVLDDKGTGFVKFSGEFLTNLLLRVIGNCFIICYGLCNSLLTYIVVFLLVMSTS